MQTKTFTQLRLKRVALVAALAASRISVSAQVPIGPPAEPTRSPQQLGCIWDAERVSPPLPPLVRHAEVESRLQKVHDDAPDLFSLEEIGRSVEGRSINHLWFGHGPFHVLLWSQMHGDEPTATVALFDVFEYVRRHREEEPVRTILRALTLHAVPMLNPDGAERFQRRNAQGIDINRDALRLQTPEGRALKALRDRLNPRLGFNLHNQNWQTSVGKAGKPASVSLLAVAYDEARSDNEGRILAKKTCSIIRDAVEAMAEGQVARYDDEFEVRAFGDNVTKWGTPVVLIETGPWPGDHPDQGLVRLNFVAIVTALDALATNRVAQADPGRYESLPMNASDLFYLLVKNASLVIGTEVPPFVADVGIVARRAVTEQEGRLQVKESFRIDDLGDLRVFSALEKVDATGLTLAPLFDPSLKRGDTVKLPVWSPRPGGPVVEVGAPADLVLLEPAAEGMYRVVRVFRAEGTAK
jgi:Zinc carboxypeptidase